MKIKKILISPQEFKESLTGLEVANAIQEGINKVDSKIKTSLVPVADGGDGTLQTMVDVTGGEIITETVRDPLGRNIDSVWGKLGDDSSAVIEMAKASGLALLNENEKSATLTSTYGTGQLFKFALDQGIKNFIIGIGGSATNDGGAGFVSALGAKLYDENGKEVESNGISLSSIRDIDMSNFDERVKNTSVRVACDVTNPLCGNEGASAIFGPQKGANPEEVNLLDKNLLHWASLIKDQLGKDILNVPGSGAAGGLGAGLMAFTDAELSIGANIVLDSLNYDEHLRDVDLVIVGEGSTDKSTQFNKSPVAVAMRAKKLGIPVICLSGSIGEGYSESRDLGISSFFSIVSGPTELKYAIENAHELIVKSTEEIIRSLLL
ncbi:MAG: glycerate kinase [SAR202 cluster bacterium]|jgi:glycerate kinase|nr:glycerate kinase [Chloroflexota bacterium]MQG20011.1 glycerate kinase [SAR202 cluster bacterium]|tara:strand:- start:9143 stop:10279 length:1137 start_codon:yes stop_codon:yes gene_type:complete